MDENTNMENFNQVSDTGLMGHEASNENITHAFLTRIEEPLNKAREIVNDSKQNPNLSPETLNRINVLERIIANLEKTPWQN